MDDRSQRLIEKANRAISQKNVTSATLALNKVRRYYPEAPEVLMADAELAFIRADIPTGTLLLTSLSKQDSISPALISTLRSRLEKYELYFPLRDVLHRIVSMFPDDNDNRLQYAQTLVQTGAITEAIHQLRICESSMPDNATVALQLGHAYKALSETNHAAKAYHDYLKLAPQFAGTAFWSLADLKDYRFSENDIEALGTASLDNDYQMALLSFARQRVAEQQGSEKAIPLLKEANVRFSKHRNFSRDGFTRLANDVQAPVPTHSAESLTHRPIFIVGMPRSGTTLTEQILAAHSDVATTDELPYIERIAIYLSNKGYYPANLEALPDGERDKCRQFYLQQAGQYPLTGTCCFIDKNPNNFIHIGLIHTLFPEAQIVCLSRPVIDNIASVYRQLFSKGNDYAYQPEDLLLYTDSFYRVMAYWKKALPEVVNMLDYEALVDNTEAVIRQLLTWCRLDFDPDCLRFYEMDTPVMTPSASQVRQPINTKSIGSGDRYRVLFDGFSITPEFIEQQRKTLLRQ